MNISSRLVRFGLVGLLNTTVDVGLFTILRSSGLSIVLANACSTTTGLIVSLLLNSRYTFGAQAPLSAKRIARFLAVTLIGLWLLQPCIIELLTYATKHISLLATLIRISGHVDVMQTVFPKLGAIAITLVWNYVWYSRFVYA
jgi:putative flippase GtrA